MKLRILLISISFPVSAALLFGCTLATKKRPGISPPMTEAVFVEGKGDAFLFDVKIHTEGKKNSVRLDVYRSGDTVALFARGYLGKGVLKGLILRDSIAVYFPTEKEFYTGPILDLVDKACSDSLPFESLIIALLKRTPAEIDHSLSHFYVTVLEEKRNKRRYRLMSKKCREAIELEYNWKDNRFVLDRMEFSKADNSFRFKADRRRARINIEIPGDKFLLSIPETAARILP
jgi:hypothetical protein